MNELEGFVLWRPDEGKPMYIRTDDKCIRICAEAYSALGAPEFVNVFLDETKRRVMIKMAKPDYQNIIRVTSHSAGHNMSLCNRRLAQKMIGLFGKARIHGHIAGDGILIFDVIEELK